MTHGARIFLIILAFQLLSANPVYLETPIIPKIDCNDLNNNGSPDFIAVNSSAAPRSLYHVEYKDSGAIFLWEYSMPENVLGYISDMILGDFDNDERMELIVAAYQDGSNKIFYIFPIDSLGFNDDPPHVIGLGNHSLSITHPGKLYPMNIDLDGAQPFILTQGSPSRHIIICKYQDGEINHVGSYGNQFLSQNAGPLELSLGNFDEDGIEDLFILSNGQKPEGYFIFSDGREKNADLNNYPRLRLLYHQGVDLNFDGIDDILMINRSGELMSNLWEKESIALYENNIQDFRVILDKDVIHLNSISQTGKIGYYSIDPFAREILTSEYTIPKFAETEFVRVYSLMTSNQIFLLNDVANQELWTSPLSLDRINVAPPPIHLQRIYSQSADSVINIGNSFIYPLKQDTTKAFIHFTEENLPLGMEFNLNDVQLEWTPTISQLGFHECSFVLEFREGEELEIAIENDIKLVSKKESMIEEKHAYLIYVNEPVKFNNNENHITFVNTKLSEWIIPIEDGNVDALLKVEKIGGDSSAQFQLLQSTTKTQLVDSVIISSEELKQINNENTQFKDVSNIEIEHHKVRFAWEPNTDQDDFQFSCAVSDGYSSDTLTFTVTIHPEINLNMNQTEFNTTVNQAISIPVGLTQSPPSEFYKYELSNEPENMWVTSNGVINWIPMTIDADNNIFELNVSDGIATSKLQYNIYVNAIPVISSRPSEPFIINLGDSVYFQLGNFDLNSDAKLKWELLSGPKEMIINTEGVLIWKGNQLDHHPYEIQLSDGIDSVHWNSSIYVNVAPVITGNPITLIAENENYDYALVAQDDNQMSPFEPDSNAKIRFELLDGPFGMEIDNQNILHWRPEVNMSGEFPVSIIASDGISNSPQNFKILVNSFPVLTSIDSFSIKIGDTLNFQIKADDLNLGDSLSYFIDDMRPGMSLNKDSGLLIWSPSQADIGQHRFNLEVKDGLGQSGTNQILRIFVYKLPIFTGDLLTEAFVGLEYTAFLTAEDMFGEKLKHAGAIIIETTTIQDYTLSEPYGHYFQWKPENIDIGNHEITIRITDKNGFTTLHNHSLSVFKNPCFQCEGSSGETPADTTRN